MIGVLLKAALTALEDAKRQVIERPLSVEDVQLLNKLSGEIASLKELWIVRNSLTTKQSAIAGALGVTPARINQVLSKTTYRIHYKV